MGNETLDGVKEYFNEDTLIDREEILIELCAYNQLRINNTVFQHKPHINIRGRKSVIDNIITNKAVYPHNILAYWLIYQFVGL